MYCTAAIWQVFKTFTWFLLLLLSPDKAKLGRICSCCSYHSYFCVSFSWICSWAMVCKEWVRANRKDGDKLLSRMFSDWTRGYGFELKKFWFRLDTRKRFFCNVGDETLEKVAQRDAGCPIPGNIWVRLDRALRILRWLKMSCVTIEKLD